MRNTNNDKMIPNNIITKPLSLAANITRIGNPIRITNTARIKFPEYNFDTLLKKFLEISDLSNLTSK